MTRVVVHAFFLLENQLIKTLAVTDNIGLPDFQNFQSLLQALKT